MTVDENLKPPFTDAFLQDLYTCITDSIDRKVERMFEEFRNEENVRFKGFESQIMETFGLLRNAGNVSSVSTGLYSMIL